VSFPTTDRGTRFRSSSRLEAEAAAAELIGGHKARLLAARPHMVPEWHHKLEPGREHAGPDGGATDRELIHIGSNGSIIRSEPNGESRYRWVAPPQPTLRGWADALAATDFGHGVTERSAPVKKSGDDAILETYLKHANITGYFEREARAVWALFKSLCDKPLKECDRNDGRKLVAHFESQGRKSATIQKKIGWLTAACNLAIKEGELKFNPFSNVAPRRKDKLKRLPLSEADIKLVKRHFDQLDEANQLLFRLLATTGMRLSEALRIWRLGNLSTPKTVQKLQKALHAKAKAGDLPTGSYQKSVHTEGQRQTQAAGHLDLAGSGLHDSSHAGAGTDLRSRSTARTARLPAWAKCPTTRVSVAGDIIGFSSST
jgi:hypothetical protein